VGSFTLDPSVPCIVLLGAMWKLIFRHCLRNDAIARRAAVLPPNAECLNLKSTR